MSADRISHVTIGTLPAAAAAAAATETCANIKSRKDPKKRCTNVATHGEYCGIHYKHPRPWNPGSPGSIAARVKYRKRAGIVMGAVEKKLAERILAWWRFYKGLYYRRYHGPAYFERGLCVNDADFFSTDSVNDISGVMFYSYKDDLNHIYGFDLRSIHTLLYRARTSASEALNPFNRAVFPKFVQKQVTVLIRKLTAWKLPTEWVPLAPPTPEQQIRMKIVDVFSKIDELNYYSSPDWFIGLSEGRHRRFYVQLFDIWTHRANLTPAQKNTIVPGFTGRLFRTPRWALADMTYDALQKMNLGVIRMMISSAEDRNDRILGAMYVVSALTLVCDGARTAYPWLYESVYEEERPAAAHHPGLDARRGGLANLLGIGWLHDLLALRDAVEAAAPLEAPALPLPPPLALPPPAQQEEQRHENDTDS
jgi:hypothetical protein